MPFCAAGSLPNRADACARISWLGPVMAVALLAASYWLWLFGLRHYVSTGS